MFIHDVAKSKIPNWNIQPLTEADAQKVCKENKIYVVDAKQVNYGKFLVYKGLNFILINPKLSGAMRLWVLWHEIAHFLLHTPETSNFSKVMARKNDKEANIIASICLIPKKNTRSKNLNELLDEFPKDLLKIRKYALDVLGL